MIQNYKFGSVIKFFLLKAQIEIRNVNNILITSGIILFVVLVPVFIGRKKFMKKK